MKHRRGKIHVYREGVFEIHDAITVWNRSITGYTIRPHIVYEKWSYFL